MELEEYNKRVDAIDAWARERYAEGRLTEEQIEFHVQMMYDDLDDDYMPSRHSGFTGAQSYADFIEE